MCAGTPPAPHVKTPKRKVGARTSNNHVHLRSHDPAPVARPRPCMTFRTDTQVWWKTRSLAFIVSKFDYLRVQLRLDRYGSWGRVTHFVSVVQPARRRRTTKPDDGNAESEICSTDRGAEPLTTTGVLRNAPTHSRHPPLAGRSFQFAKPSGGFVCVLVYWVVRRH